jgi:hypothetical protein
MTTNLPELREGTLATPLPPPEPEGNRLLDAVGGLFDHVIDRILLSPDRVTSAAEGKRLVAADDDTEDVADRVQRRSCGRSRVGRGSSRASRGCSWRARPPTSS